MVLVLWQEYFPRRLRIFWNRVWNSGIICWIIYVITPPSRLRFLDTSKLWLFLQATSWSVTMRSRGWLCRPSTITVKLLSGKLVPIFTMCQPSHMAKTRWDHFGKLSGGDSGTHKKSLLIIEAMPCFYRVLIQSGVTNWKLDSKQNWKGPWH